MESELFKIVLKKFMLQRIKQNGIEYIYAYIIHFQRVLRNLLQNLVKSYNWLDNSV
jgi:hypothetical protein